MREVADDKGVSVDWECTRPPRFVQRPYAIQRHSYAPLTSLWSAVTS